MQSNKAKPQVIQYEHNSSFQPALLSFDGFIETNKAEKTSRIGLPVMSSKNIDLSPNQFAILEPGKSGSAVSIGLTTCAGVVYLYQDVNGKNEKIIVYHAPSSTLLEGMDPYSLGKKAGVSNLNANNIKIVMGVNSKPGCESTEKLIFELVNEHKIQPTNIIVYYDTNSFGADSNGNFGERGPDYRGFAFLLFQKKLINLIDDSIKHEPKMLKKSIFGQIQVANYEEKLRTNIQNSHTFAAIKKYLLEGLTKTDEPFQVSLLLGLHDLFQSIFKETIIVPKSEMLLAKVLNYLDTFAEKIEDENDSNRILALLSPLLPSISLEEKINSVTHNPQQNTDTSSKSGKRELHNKN